MSRIGDIFEATILTKDGSLVEKIRGGQKYRLVSECVLTEPAFDNPGTRDRAQKSGIRSHRLAAPGLEIAGPGLAGSCQQDLVSVRPVSHFSEVVEYLNAGTTCRR